MAHRGVALCLHHRQLLEQGDLLLRLLRQLRLLLLPVGTRFAGRPFDDVTFGEAACRLHLPAACSGSSARPSFAQSRFHVWEQCSGWLLGRGEMLSVAR